MTQDMGGLILGELDSPLVVAAVALSIIRSRHG